jgi:hypothetical protein
MELFAKKIDEVNYKPSLTGIYGRWSDHIWRDENSGETIMFAKLDEGISYTKMKVFGPTHYYVIKGELIINDQKFDSGTYIRIDSDEEFTPRTEKGCEVLCIYTKGYYR